MRRESTGIQRKNEPAEIEKKIQKRKVLKMKMSSGTKITGMKVVKIAPWSPLPLLCLCGATKIIRHVDSKCYRSSRNYKKSGRNGKYSWMNIIPRSWLWNVYNTDESRIKSSPTVPWLTYK